MLPFGTRAWKLCVGSGRDDADRLAFRGDRFGARMWLSPAKSDAMKMRVMRTALARETPRDVSRMSNDAILDAIADLLARGRLYVHADAPRTVSAAVAAPEPAPVAVPRASRRSPATSSAAPILAPTFPPGVNLSQQAAVLVAAATEGAPFCPM